MKKLILPLLTLALAAPAIQAGELHQVMGKREGRTNHGFMYEDKDCKTCHQGAPKGPADETACIECHGSYQELAQSTEKISPNPHDAPHWGPDVPCSVCHSEHQEAKVLCNDCHQFNFKNFSK